MAGTTLRLAPDAFQGRKLGKYEVLCRLSTGGMAEIFLASQRGLAGFRKLVVLKQILPDIAGEEEFVRMFLDEAKVTAAFNHPHIAQVYDLDVADGELFLSMEFVPGATLVEVARAVRGVNESIPLGFSLMAVRDTAVALHYAHVFTDPLGRPSPVIHRDVAEKNIMVTYEGVTKLLDFGIAKSLAQASRTAVGMVKGTSGYMSPEQILGEPLDARSDLFSLGVVLHECLTGMRLFYAKQAEAMMNAVLKCEVPPPSRINRAISPELDAIVLKSLARKREDRYASTLEFARALERAVGPLIWHPEQSAELMQRLFADRREQTRQLLVAGQGADATSEVNLAQVLAMGSVENPEPGSGSGRPLLTPALPARASTPPAPAAKAPTPVPQPPRATPPAPVAPHAPRRATVSTPVPPAPAPAPEGDASLRRAVLSPPPAQKRAPQKAADAARTPPPPQSEAQAVPPPAPSGSTARTQQHTALPPEFTLRGQLSAPAPVVPHAERETVMAAVPRAPTRDHLPAVAEAPRPPDEPRPRAARNASPDTSRAPQPPTVPDGLTAVVRMPVASGEAPTGVAPRTTTADSPRASQAPTAPDGLTAVRRMPVAPPAPAGAPASAAAVARRPAPRRRPAPAPVSHHPEPDPDEPVTHPVRALQDWGPEEEDPAALGDPDAHEHTPRALRARRPEKRRGRVWPVAAGLVVLVGMLGVSAMALGWDGGRMAPLWNAALARAGVQSGEAPTTPPAAAPAKQDAPATASADARPSTTTSPSAPGAIATASPTPPGDTARASAGSTPSEAPTGGGAPTAPESDGAQPAAVALADTTGSSEPAAAPAPADPAEESPALDEAASTKKAPRALAKRVKRDAAEAPARKPRVASASESESADAAGATEAAAPEAEQGFLTLVTEPSATVYLAGRSLGNTPLFKVALPAGEHSLKLVDGEGRALKLAVDIKSGDTTALRVPLDMLAR